MAGKTVLWFCFYLLIKELYIYIIGLQSLLVEKNFLEIVFRGAGDINNSNNILGLAGGINVNGNLPGRNQ